MATKIEGATSGNIAEVNSSNELKVALPASQANAGYAAIAACADDGLVTAARTIRDIDSSPDFRLRVGRDSILFQEYFAGTNVNTSIWGIPIATATTAQGGGFLTLNNSGSLTAAQGGLLRSNRTFPIYSSYPTYFDFLANIAISPFNNAQAEVGAGLIGVAPATGCTDGAFFRITNTGLSCVVANNGSEVAETSILPATLALNGIILTNTNHYLVSITDDQVEYWVNHILVCRILRSTIGVQPTLSQQLGIFGRVINTGTNTQNALKLNIAMAAVSMGDMDLGMPFSHRMAAAGNMALQAQSGYAAGRTSAFNNWTTMPAQMTSASVTAIGTAGTTGLGGRQRWGNGAGTLALSADSAYIIFTYLVPVLSVAAPIIPAKSLILTGLKISACSRGAAGAAGLCTFMYALMIGCANANPATAENGATPVKQARPVELGMSSLPASAAVGTMFSPDAQVMFDSPIVSYAGEYITVTATPMVAYTIAANQEIVFSCTPIGYWK